MALGPRSPGAPKHQACLRCPACHRRLVPLHRCRSLLHRLRRRRPRRRRLLHRHPCLRSISSLLRDRCRLLECPRLRWLRQRSAQACRRLLLPRARACPSLLPDRRESRPEALRRCRLLLPDRRAVSRRLRLRSAALRLSRLRSLACLALRRPCRRPLPCRSRVPCRHRRQGIRSRTCLLARRHRLTCRILRCRASLLPRPCLRLHRPPRLRPCPQQVASPVASS